MNDPRIELPHGYVVIATQIAYWQWTDATSGKPGTHGQPAELHIQTTGGPVKYFREEAMNAKKKLESYFSYSGTQ